MFWKSRSTFIYFGFYFILCYRPTREKNAFFSSIWNFKFFWTVNFKSICFALNATAKIWHVERWWNEITHTKAVNVVWCMCMHTIAFQTIGVVQNSLKEKPSSRSHFYNINSILALYTLSHFIDKANRWLMILFHRCCCCCRCCYAIGIETKMNEITFTPQRIQRTSSYKNKMEWNSVRYKNAPKIWTDLQIIH